jgi:hypothetical protein
LAIPLYFLLWVFGIYDAYSTAQKKEGKEKPVSQQQQQQQVVVLGKSEEGRTKKRICPKCGM